MKRVSLEMRRASLWQVALICELERQGTVAVCTCRPRGLCRAHEAASSDGLGNNGHTVLSVSWAEVSAPTMLEGAFSRAV